MASSPDHAALVVGDQGVPAEGVDRGLRVRGEVVGAEVRRDHVDVVVERAGARLHHEGVARPVGEGGAVDHLGAVHRQPAGVLRVRALVGHHDPEPPDLGVHHGVEGVERLAVQLHPAIPDVVRGHRVLDRQQRHQLVVAQDHLAGRVDHEADVEEAAGELRVPRLCLGHDEHVPLARQLAQALGLGSRDVDRALARVLLVVEVHHLVGEALEGALGDRHQAHRLVQPAQPERRLDQVLQMVEVLRDLLAAPDAPHRGHQPDRLVGRRHRARR